jgi:DNA polymerase III delta subunit
MAKRKGWNWKKAPPAAAISGSEGFLRRRALSMAIKGATMSGRKVEFVDGKEPEALSDALSSSALFAEPMLFVVTGIGDIDPFEIGSHVEEGDNTISILLVCEGDPKGKEAEVVEFVPERYRLSFPKPPPYKVPEVAAKFVIEEAKRREMEFPPDLADAIVSKVGSDLGTLSFEILKAEMLLLARGDGPKVTPAHVKETMALGGEVDIGAVVDAVGRASAARTLKAMDAVRENSAKDPTLQVVAWVGNRATTWLHAATLVAQGAGEDEGASRTGTPPYVYKSFIVPVARRWGTSRLMSLLRRLATAEASVKAGHVAPWTQLECGLVAACRSVGGGR